MLKENSKIYNAVIILTIITGIILLIIQLIDKEKTLIIPQYVLLTGLLSGLGYIGVNNIGTKLVRDISFAIMSIILSATTIYF